MINLLPPEYKKELAQEENWKLITIIGIFILLFLISFSLILFSIKFFLFGEVETQKILYSQREKEFQTSQIQLLEKEITTSNEKLSQLDNFYKNQRKITEILEKISGTLPVGSYLTNISLTSPETGKITFNLAGFAPSREILLEFKQNLEKEEMFTGISFLSSNWVEPININFSVDFETK